MCLCALLFGCSRSEPDASPNDPPRASERDERTPETATNGTEIPPPETTAPLAATAPQPTTGPSLPEGVTAKDVAGRPIGVAGVAGQPWFALAGDGGVARPDGMTAVGQIPLRLAATADGVWVSVFGDGNVTKLALDGSVETTIELGPGAEPEGLALDGDVLWIVDQAADAALAVDTTTSQIVARVQVGEGPRLVALGTADMWVTSYGDGGITAVDRATRTTRAAAQNVCGGIQGVAEAAGVVWVACTADDTVIGLDIITLTEVARFSLDRADAVTTDGNRVFAVGQTGPTVLQIDTATRQEQKTTVLSDAGAVRDGNVDAAIVGADLVVTHPDLGQAFQLTLG